MRLAALIITATSLSLTGQYIAFMFSKRVRLLEKLQIMICSVLNEVKFLSRPADEIISMLCARSDLSELKFISYCKTEIVNGADFKTAINNSLIQKENVRYFHKSDIALIKSFAEHFGTTDIQGQISNCMLYQELIKEKLKEAKELKDKYSSLSSGLGLLVGIGLIIVLI